MPRRRYSVAQLVDAGDRAAERSAGQHALAPPAHAQGECRALPCSSSATLTRLRIIR